jgi:hypothetical protein
MYTTKLFACCLNVSKYFGINSRMPLNYSWKIEAHNLHKYGDIIDMDGAILELMIRHITADLNGFV